MLTFVVRMGHAEEPPPPTEATPPPDDATAPVEPTSAAPAESEAPAPPPPAAPAPKPPAPPYSLPWSLRPAIMSTAVRVDAAFAFEDKGQMAFASTLTASYKAAPNFGPLMRIAFVHDTRSASSAISNPAFGVLYTPELVTGLRLPLFLGVNMPAGSGGGSPADPDAKKPARTPGGYAAEGAGVYARSAMDNMLFGVNYVTVVFGAGLAYVGHGFTFQAEAALFDAIRERGELYEVDALRTNLTAGAHVGYTPIKELTFSVELRYQRWLSAPSVIAKDPSREDQLTVGGGIRTRIVVVPDKVILRPGIAYFNPVDDPMLGAGYRVIVVDVPVVF